LRDAVRSTGLEGGLSGSFAFDENGDRVPQSGDAVSDVVDEALSGGGYTVLAAAGAEEALAVASLHPGSIDLLITEVMLARLNGAELAARLRQTRPALRTLFVVEDVGEPDPRRALHAPEDWLVHRTFSPESLLEKVARALADQPR
jgi:CheY-like chemotaxis protein